jgi:hypothetical protein
MDTPTEKQITAINNMASSMGERYDIPATKEECRVLIGWMIKQIGKRLSANGSFRIDSGFDDIDANYYGEI